MKSQTFHFYGRTTYPQPLEFVDILSIEGADDLPEAAASLTNQEDWVELIAFPETAIIQVIPSEEA